jgi:uncharacterized protein YabN with tetrapyrrole methylase and pyrophosphatase domain
MNSLVVVGFGIKFISHLTTETKAYIEKADKILYLVNDPAAKDWIKNNHPHTESLDPLYQAYELRKDCYAAITKYILQQLRQTQHLCVILYGHPAVFAEPGLNAVIHAKAEGFDARVLPGISAEDCLFADLLVNPASSGCQSFEASDFIIYERSYNPASHLILWQVGFIGALGHLQAHDNTIGIKLLTEYLARRYPLKHEITLYEAAQYAHFKPRVDKLWLKDLPNAKLTPITTLYVPPAVKSQRNQAVLDALGIEL